MSIDTTALIDVPTLAERLGTSVRHIRRLLNERRVPYYKVGGLVRFDPLEIDAWVRSQRVEAEGSARAAS